MGQTNKISILLKILISLFYLYVEESFPYYMNHEVAAIKFYCVGPRSS